MICIDSDCIIDFLKGKKEAVQTIEKYKEEIATTEINIFEVFYGVYAYNLNEAESAEQFFDSIALLNIDGWGKEAAKIFTELIKKGRQINQNDCLIVGIMLMNNCYTIITKNKEHFSRIKNIKIISY